MAEELLLFMLLIAAVSAVGNTLVVAALDSRLLRGSSATLVKIVFFNAAYSVVSSVIVLLASLSGVIAYETGLARHVDSLYRFYQAASIVLGVGIIGIFKVFMNRRLGMPPQQALRASFAALTVTAIFAALALVVFYVVVSGIDYR